MHGLALMAPWFFSWKALIIAFALNFAFGSLGVSLGYHRLLAHSSLKVPKWLERVLVLLGVLALQGSPLSWVGMHRMHHKHSDTELDPHTAKRGFWWSHIGWAFYLTQNAYRKYAPKFMQEERFYRFFDRFVLTNLLLLQVPLGVVLYLLGGWSFVVYGVFLRIVILWHSTFLVNSATHFWGYRNYFVSEGDRSGNVWWLAPFTFGEAWHNNHHAQPRSAKIGHRFWEIDVTWYLILLFKVLGLATAVQLPLPRARRVI
jgi:stearoyl-CoA desaturase (delta-9 desaturase)